jgi:uncharacterized protein
MAHSRAHLRSSPLGMLLLLCLLKLECVVAAPTIPSLSSEVVDSAKIFQPSEAAGLRAAIADLNATKNIQLVVVTVPELGGNAIEDYALQIAETWKLGKKGEDRGVVLLIAHQDRRMRFEVGYGLEGELTDIVTKRILSDVITPEFRKARYAAGVGAGVEAVRAVLSGEWVPPKKKGRQSLPVPIGLLILGAVGFLLLMLLSGGAPPGRGWSSGHRNSDRFGGWGGGGGFGGGGFGGGGGGFSGGGGGFGGGGSSSSW